MVWWTSYASVFIPIFHKLSRFGPGIDIHNLIVYIICSPWVLVSCYIAILQACISLS